MIRVTECAYNKTTSETAKNQIKMSLDGMQNFPEAYFTAEANANRIIALKNLNANLDGCI